MSEGTIIRMPTADANVTKSVQDGQIINVPAQLEAARREVERLESLSRLMTPQKPILEPAKPPEVKLDLACGQSPREGFEGVDFYAPNAKHKIDLTVYPWPFETSSVDELHTSHYAEHIPMELVEHNGKKKDALFAFFDECHRILKPGGTLTVIVPAGQSTRAFQDPTHRRFIVPATFGYFSAEWRKINKLDHYQVDCDYQVNCNWTCDQVENTKAPEAAAYRIQHLWNVMVDLHALLKCVKPDPKKK